jgi:type I restriction enzyme M protein
MYLNFEESEESKIFDNEAFGYYKVTIERPLRLKAQITQEAIEKLLYASSDEEIRRELHERFGDAIFSDFNTPQIAKVLDDWADEEDEESKGLSEKVKKKLLDASSWKRDAKLSKMAQMLEDALGGGVYEDYNVFVSEVDKVFKKHNIKLATAEKKTLLSALSFKDESAPAVIKKIHKKGMSADPIRGLYEVVLEGKNVVVEYESDSELRDSEQVPLLEEGGIEAFVRREVLPYAPDSWYDESSIKVGCEISFTKHFYKPKSLRSLEEIKADIAALEQESEGMLREIIG